MEWSIIQSRQCRKIFTLLGAMLLVMPGGVFAYWGNISVYVSSYIYCCLSSNSQVEATWVITLFDIFWTLVMVFTGVISNYVQERCLVIAGMVIITGAHFLTYFTVKMSWIALNLTLGVLIGVGVGLSYGKGIDIVAQTAGKDLGMMSSLFVTMPSLGGVLMAQVSTWYVNPPNETPDVELGTNRYFTHTDIVDKVPSMFLVLGGISLAMNILAVIFLQFYPETSFMHCVDKKKEPLDVIPLDANRKSDENVLNNKQYSGDESRDIHLPSYDSCSKENGKALDLNLDNKESRSIDFTPREMLKTPMFYAVWIAFLTSNIAYVVMLNFYKLYGQKWIPDDHFLTNIGTANFLITSVARVASGWAMDTLGCRHCLMVLLGVTVISSAWCYLTAMADKWLYLLTTLLFGMSSGGCFSCLVACGGFLFGRGHVTINTAIIMTANLTSSVFVPFLADFLLANVGWFSVFAGSGALNVISLFLCMVLIP